MSVQDDRPAVDLPHQGDLAFSALMDALVPDGSTEAPGGQEAPGAGPAAGGDPAVAEAPGGGAAASAQGQGAGAGGAAGGAEGAGAGPGQAGQPAAGGDAKDKGAGRGDQGAAAGAADGGAGQPPAASGGTAPATAGIDPATIIPKLGELSTAFEENTTRAYQQKAYSEAREEYEPYFDALDKHPRLLVGTQVPAIGKEGMETLRSSDDAREWQEAVKSLLVEEIKSRAQQQVEEAGSFLETVHASIDLFKNNPDLIPGAKGFDRGLADQFAAMAKPYEVRVEGKLQGYSIPVQPIIDNLRAQRKAQTPSGSPPSPAAAPAAAPAAPPSTEPPQAGIPSKSGSSSEREDFSTLFGTIGLPNLQI